MGNERLYVCVCVCGCNVLGYGRKRREVHCPRGKCKLDATAWTLARMH